MTMTPGTSGRATGSAQGTDPPAGGTLLNSAADELARIRRKMPSLLNNLSFRMRDGGHPFPLLHFGEPHKVVRLDEDMAGAAEDWFFIGDLHGDFFRAAQPAAARGSDAHPGCKILFLGDMVDRGDHPFECIFLLLEWGLRHPGRLAWIAGNHDIAFDLPEGQTFFSTLVSPAELLQVINKVDELQGFRLKLGRFVVELGKRLPRAMLFPDGLLATHGGFPLADLHAAGAATETEADYLAWLNSPACLKDFTWTRIHRAPKKLPDRYSTGSQYGFKDFEAFCALKPEWFPVQRMVTGHEHPADGHAVHASYKVNPALTLVGFGFDDLRPMPHAYRHYHEALYIGQGRSGELPTVLTVPVDQQELDWMYPPPETAPEPSATTDTDPAPPATAPTASEA